MIAIRINMLSNAEREKLVIDLYYNQRKNVLQIAQEARISFRDIAAILKKKDEVEAIDYKKTMAKYQLDDMNNQISYLNRISYSKRNEIEYLKMGVQELEGHIHGLENHNQQQHKIQNE